MNDNLNLPHFYKSMPHKSILNDNNQSINLPITNKYKWKIYSSLKFKNFIGYSNVLCNLSDFILNKIYSNRLDTLYHSCGLLIHGPPGTGKSLLPYILSGEFAFPLLVVNGFDMNSSNLGLTDKKLNTLFVEMKHFAKKYYEMFPYKMIILCIDDIDVMLNKNDTSRESDQRLISQLNNYFDEMSNLKNHNLIVIGITKNVELIDASLKRSGRFDKDINLGMPNEPSRLEIISHFCSNYKIAEDVNFHKIVTNTPGFVGADLKSLVNEAYLMAYKRIKNIALDGANDKLSYYMNQIKSADKVSNLNYANVKDKIIINNLDFEMTLSNIVPSCKTEGFYSAASTINTSLPESENKVGNDSNKFNIRWDDGIGALFKVKKELTLCVRGAILYPEIYGLYGLPNTGSGVLLVGPPGCGKTLLARAVARESSLNFIAIKGPELLNMYVGETEKAVRKCFLRAKDSAPCLIFFDEIDSLCPRRGGSGIDGDHNMGVENSASRIVNQLLTEMDGLDSRNSVFVMGATNRLDVLDAAILRPGRFDKIFHIDLPTTEERIDILRVIMHDFENTSSAHFKCGLSYTNNKVSPAPAHKLYSTDIDLQVIASDARCEGFSGADLAALVKEASYQALNHIIDDFEAVAKDVSENDVRNTQSTAKKICNGIPKVEKLNEMKIKPIINMEHFNQALNIVKPSISNERKLYYEKLKTL